MKSLLIGIDGSDGSRVALRWAAAVSDALMLRLRVLWVWEYPASAVVALGGVDLPDPDAADTAVAEQLKGILVEELGEEGARRVTAKVARGPAASTLLRAAETTPKMIVVGSRGLGGFKGLLLGSVGRQLAEHAPCPVTVVPRTTPVDPVSLETIVVGVDGSAHAARAMLCATDFAGRAGAEVVVAHAVDTVEPLDPGAHVPEVDPRPELDARTELVEEWATPLRQLGVPYRVRVVEGDPRATLLEVAEEEGADAVVVGSRGRGPVRKLLLGSVAASVAQYSPVPVTIVPRRA
ncbi:MAG: universal stress protein [Egibacteraceae bacterium]